jgi:hypothetical protein
MTTSDPATDPDPAPGFGVTPGFEAGPRPHERYDSLARFYNDDERRVRSREVDVGLWWREDGEGPLHRAAWVADTGEMYLVRLGEPVDGGGEVELLARVGSRERLERALEGWREQCGMPRSLSWLRGRARRLRGWTPAGAPGRYPRRRVARIA